MGVHRELRMVSVASHEVFIGANGNQRGLILFLTDSRAQVDSNERTRPRQPRCWRSKLGHARTADRDPQTEPSSAALLPNRRPYSHRKWP